jgi:hypothetical protein
MMRAPPAHKSGTAAQRVNPVEPQVLPYGYDTRLPRRLKKAAHAPKPSDMKAAK